MLDRAERMRALEETLNTTGWGVLHDFLTIQRETDMITLSSAKRDLPDDYLRGRISVMTWVLEGLTQEVNEYFRDHDKQAQSVDGQPAHEDVGHPYSPDTGGQPFLEGEDFNR